MRLTPVLLLQAGEDELHFLVGTGDHVDGNQLAHPLSGGGAGVGGRLDSAHIATDHDGHQTAARMV